MPETLVPILVFLAVVSTGGALALALRRRRPVTARLLAQDGTLAIDPGQRSAARLVSRVGSAFASDPGALRAKLARAGYYAESAATTYVGLKLLLFVTGLLALTLLVLPLGLGLPAKVWLVLLGSALLLFLPNVVVLARIRARTREVRIHLPDAIDLLEVCVSSGMGLDQAWNAVGDEIRRVSGVLADEMALTNLEIQLGATRSDALRHLADRTGADEFSSLVALLVQSQRFGTSIADALATFAASMRETRSQQAEEAAEKMAVKLLFPLVLFIFPVMLIVMTGPTIITLARVFSQS